jgi:hypothetical protein
MIRGLIPSMGNIVIILFKGATKMIIADKGSVHAYKLNHIEVTSIKLFLNHSI